jgi:hypothetical protein
MKFLIPYVLYLCLSWLVGGIVLAFIHKRVRPVVQAIVYTVLFGGPLFIGFYVYAEQAIWEYNFKKDVAYVKELCARDGGDKIYRTVQGVEGIFQVTYRAGDTDESWRDQFGMQDPWGRAQGDSDAPALAIGPDVKDGYWFVEQRTGPGLGPPIRRRFSSTKDAKREILVNRLRSRYGYVTEDLSTPEMRKRWIGAGRIRIVDLQSNEVIAERRGYFRAIGPVARLAWAGTDAFQNGRMCPNDRIWEFVSRVLRPIGTPPTDVQLKQMKEE